MSDVQDNNQHNEPIKIDRIKEKRMRIVEEQKKRLLNRGVKPEDLERVLAQESWNRVPIEKKFDWLNGIVSNSLRQISMDMNTIQDNIFSIAEAMDVNFKAFKEMLIKLGITQEEQKRYIAEAEKKIADERKAVAEAAAAQQNQQPTPPTTLEVNDEVKIEESTKVNEADSGKPSGS